MASERNTCGLKRNLKLLVVLYQSVDVEENDQLFKSIHYLGTYSLLRVLL